MSATARTYLSVADTAKLVRKALAANFPGVKFSVRSKSYSGGASITIYWTDGPNTAAVNPIAQRYAGADFDGMTDLKSYHDSVVVGPDGPKVIHYGADFVFCQRTESQWETRKAEALAIIRERCHLEDNGQRFGNDWIDNLAAGMVRDLNFYTGETLDTTFRRVVLRERI